MLGYRDAQRDPNALGIEADELRAFPVDTRFTERLRSTRNLIRRVASSLVEKTKGETHDAGLQVVDASATPTSTCITWSLATTKAVASII